MGAGSADRSIRPSVRLKLKYVWMVQPSPLPGYFSKSFQNVLSLLGTSTIHETEKNSMSNEYHLSSEDLVESLVDAVNRNGDFKQLSSYSIQCISKVRNC